MAVQAVASAGRISLRPTGRGTSRGWPVILRSLSCGCPVKGYAGENR